MMYVKPITAEDVLRWDEPSGPVGEFDHYDVAGRPVDAAGNVIRSTPWEHLQELGGAAQQAGSWLVGALPRPSFSIGSPVQNLAQQVADEYNAQRMDHALPEWPVDITAGTAAAPGVNTGLIDQYHESLLHGMLPFDQQPTIPGTSAGGYGGGGGYSAADEEARRQLDRLFAQKQHELELQGIERYYGPTLAKADAQIAAEERRLGKDTGLYGSLMRNLPNLYRKVGMVTDRHLANAQKAMSLQDGKARGQIDQVFASSVGRMRAMVLSTSAASPEAGDTLAQGVDEIAAYIGRGMASDRSGWDNVIAASHQLALASATAAMDASAGALWQDRERAITAYENTIDEMMLEKKRLTGARDAAMQQTREEFALAVQEREAGWALSDAQRAAAAGQGGAARAAAERLYQYLPGDEGIFTAEGYIRGGALNFLQGAGFPPTQRDRLMNLLGVVVLQQGSSMGAFMADLQARIDNPVDLSEAELRSLQSELDWLRSAAVEPYLYEAEDHMRALSDDYDRMILTPDASNPFEVAAAIYQGGPPSWDTEQRMMAADYAINEAKAPGNALLGLGIAPAGLTFGGAVPSISGNVFSGTYTGTVSPNTGVNLDRLLAGGP